MTTRFEIIRARIAHTVLVGCGCVALHTPNATASVSIGGGYDYVQGAGDQQTGSALAFIGGPLSTRVHATLAGIRYDDAIAGEGNGVLAGLAIGVTPAARLRAWGTRYFGDADFSAWRVKAGPEATLPTGGTIGVYFAHDESNVGEPSNAGIAELGVPLVPTLTGRAGGSYSVTRGTSNSVFGSLGIGWSPVRNFQITGDVGRSSNGVASTSTTRPRGPLPILGGGETTSTTADPQAATVFQFGVRLVFP